MQSLITAAGMGISAVVSRLDEIPEKDQALLKNSAALLNQAISETRSVSHNLIPDFIKSHGLENYLNLIVNTVRSSTDIQLDVEINLEGEVLHNRLQIYLCRFVQEMINNTLKHAKAKLITIKIMRTTNEIQLDFQDDGIGFDTSQNTEGIGIQNLRKKANDVNGQLTIESEAGKGTNIHLTLQTDNF